MLRVEQARVFPRVLGCVLAIVMAGIGVGEAAAKARSKKPPEVVSESPLAGVTPPQARFFTINAVLAKLDGRRGPGAVQWASAASSDRQNTLSDVSAPSVALAVPSDEPFGLVTFRAPEGLLWNKWRGVQSRMRTEAKAIVDCRSDGDRCSAVEDRFIAMSRAAQGAEPRARAEIINRGVNAAVRYVSDYQQHGVADLWSSPLETLSTGIGDCEDYAIAKYALLQAAGIADADLKLLLVRDLAVRQDHAVLAVRLEGRWLVLDNRRSTLLEGRDLQSMMPLFALDQRGVSLFAAPYAERPRHESETEMMPAAADAGNAIGFGSTLPLLL
jgi:predicted transglutaminase-like cysteine proteinase